MNRILSLGLLLVAAPLAAQQPGMMGQGMPHMMEMEQMMAPMMGAMAFTPDHLLGHKDSLALTPQQVTRLTAIRDAAKTAHDAAAAEGKMHMDELAQAFQAGTPDTAAVKVHFQAAHAAMGKAHWAMLTAAAQAKAVLTDAQRAKVTAWAAAMRHEEHH
jgi:Spy/CpxP family protein refolding chaperone